MVQQIYKYAVRIFLDGIFLEYVLMVFKGREI